MTISEESLTTSYGLTCSYGIDWMRRVSIMNGTLKTMMMNFSRRPLETLIMPVLRLPKKDIVGLLN